jgi:hypothetical protein
MSTFIAISHEQGWENMLHQHKLIKVGQCQLRRLDKTEAKRCLNQIHREVDPGSWEWPEEDKILEGPPDR